MKDLIEYLCQGLAVQPVSVQPLEGQAGEAWLLVIRQQDMGRILGRGGSMIKSIRQLLNASATVRKTTVKLEIEEQA